MTELCHTCNKTFADYKELSLHIIKNKGTHNNRQSQYWAKVYLSDHKRLDRKLAMKNLVRTPLTDDEKINKEDTRRELSGETKLVTTLCLKGKHSAQQQLPIEYADSTEAWRIQGHLVVTCPDCGGD